MQGRSLTGAVLVFFASFWAMAQTPAAMFIGAPPASQDPLLRKLAEQAGYVEAFTAFCGGINRLAMSNDMVQLQAWQQRNNWANEKPKIDADSSLQTIYTTTRENTRAQLQAHRFKSVFHCAVLQQELRSADHDPSLSAPNAAEHPNELTAMAAPPAGAAPTTASGAPSGAVPSSDPATPAGHGGPRGTPAAAAANPATETTASATASALGVAPVAQPATGNELTVGAMTFTPPPNWQVQRNTPEAVLLRQRTQHNTAVLLVTTAPFNGNLQQSLYTAVRTNFPGTGLTFRYPHTGTTGGGSPAMYILDTGTINRQYEDVAAVGIAIGGKLQMALLISSQWGGEEVGFRRQLDTMMSAAKLHGEAEAWDPVHPPQPVGGRSGFFFGARMQNQLNPLGGMDLQAVREYVLLLPTGQAYYGLPVGGHVLDMDFAAACLQFPQKCGTYKIQNGTISFIERDSYGLVTRSSSPFTAGTPGHASIGTYHGTRASEVLPVHNLRIAGKFTSTFAQSGSIGAPTVSSSVVAQTFISFSANGTYQKSGFSSASFSGGGAGATTMNNRGLGSGQYSLEGYTLTLTPASGQPELYTAVFENQDPNPKAVFINDKAFLRDGSY